MNLNRVEASIFESAVTHRSGEHFYDPYTIEIQPQYKEFNNTETQTFKFYSKIKGGYLSQPDKFDFSIESLDNFNYELINPLKVIITMCGNELTGYISELDLYAFGDSLEIVIDELKGDVIDLYDFYSGANWNELGEEPTEWKKFLLKVIKFNG